MYRFLSRGALYVQVASIDGEDAVERMKAAWGVAENGINAAFNSLNAVLMNEEHRPAAFEALKSQVCGAYFCKVGLEAAMHACLNTSDDVTSPLHRVFRQESPL